MSMIKSEQYFEKKRELALAALTSLLTFMDFENCDVPVPYEFLETMQGLAAIVKNPDAFIFHDENGRWNNQSQLDEYRRRLEGIKQSIERATTPVSVEEETAIKFCPSCERYVISKIAMKCLWCGYALEEEHNSELSKQRILRWWT
jgi:hypothetical protein